MAKTIWIALVLSLATLAAQAQTPAPNVSLIPNSDMELDADGDQWPDGWPKLKANGSWVAEDGNHFIRLTSPAPGTMVMLYREVAIPAGTKALSLSWRQRVTGLQVGEQPWFDARIMMEFMNAAREKVSPGPNVPYARKDTAGWEVKSLQIDVPEGATILKFMPSLFNVAAGTFDLDVVVLETAAPAPAQ
jgi:hypothetical protein